jgi:formamidopyrimidine-DNA glycosylase
MPELPELEVVREVLSRRVIGRAITAVELVAPGAAIVLRNLTGDAADAALIGACFDNVRRHGKFLAFDLSRAGVTSYLTLNPKLTGRLQLAQPGDKRMAKTHVILSLDDGAQLRYVDQKQMGQLYLTREPPEQAAAIHDFAGVGPDALAVSRDDFLSRLRKHPGEIKNILINSAFVIGIGNAYVDEILWHARIHPYRKRPSLDAAELDALYTAMRETLLTSIEVVRAEMGEDIHRKPREFMAVHMKTGQPCPRCGSAISIVGANQRITNFCRTCQPGGLIRGMTTSASPG